mgnify:CR=1 FL=1
MAIPSGSGTEVLKRFGDEGINGNAAVANLTVPTNHIFTILTIHVAETANNAELLTLYMTNGSDSNSASRFVRKLALPGYGNYVHNDRLVMHPADTLTVYTDDTSSLDVWISYIDQDWS